MESSGRKAKFISETQPHLLPCTIDHTGPINADTKVWSVTWNNVINGMSTSQMSKSSKNHKGLQHQLNMHIFVGESSTDDI